MNIQIYCGKKNFDVQKAERYFRERRIAYQLLDLKKHKLGEREVRLMVSAVGMEQILDRDNPKVRENPACYFDRAEMLVAAIQEEPWLLRTPVVRNGNRITVGYRPEVWSQWE